MEEEKLGIKKEEIQAVAQPPITKPEVLSYNGKVQVTRTWPPSVREETILVRAFATEPAKVSVGRGVTINIGNYQSARIDVMVSLPCYLEEIEQTYRYAKELAEKWVLEERLKIEKELYSEEQDSGSGI
jgi:hypothetical protein